jgi:hypothetical protein
LRSIVMVVGLLLVLLSCITFGLEILELVLQTYLIIMRMAGALLSRENKSLAL